MTGGGGGGGVGPPSQPPPPQQSQPAPPSNGGEFLLQLLQKPQSTPISSSSSPSPSPSPSTTLHLNPSFQFNGHHHQSPPWMNHPNPNNPNPSDFHGFHTPPNTTNTPWGLAGLSPPPNLPFSGPHHAQPQIFGDEFHRLGLNGRLGYQPPQSTPPPQQREHGLMMFGSVPVDFKNRDGNLLDQLNREVSRMNLEPQFVGGASGGSGVWGSPSRNSEFDRDLNLLGRQAWSNSPQGGGGRQHGTGPMVESRSAPPGFPQKPKRVDQRGSGSARREKEGNVGKEPNWEGSNHQASRSYNKADLVKGNSPGIQGNASSRSRLSGQMDHPGPPVGSKLRSVPALDIEQSLGILHGQNVEENDHDYLGMHENWNRDEASDPTHQMSHSGVQEDMGEQLMNSIRLSNGWANNIKRDHNNSREDFRVDISRELHPPFQRAGNHRRVVDCRNDIDSMNTPFLAIYDSLVPPEEEKAKQKQLLTSLEKLVNKEWPNAQLYLYGSCANSFGVSHSDIDVCLAIEEENINKSELLLKLADILQEDNLQNVQALTRARVPIVKLMDPVTGISCDICINNVLAVVNTKLLRDYAQIDDRLRQLAFIVKHWAKSRGVNVTYHGTLSSYAYVLMCIHFLQQRRPAILPCLQGMKPTYVVRVDDIECAYFDQVQNLRDFGARNKETIAQLVWSFFDYWAYRHDYANSVISVRTGSIISKRAKDWTRRIGNDRHLICIEDPFEISHDLGRVVDKYSIKILREEFQRAADIMQYDPNPCVTLFEPYVPNPK